LITLPQIIASADEKVSPWWACRIHCDQGAQ